MPSKSSKSPHRTFVPTLDIHGNYGRCTAKKSLDCQRRGIAKMRADGVLVFTLEKVVRSCGPVRTVEMQWPSQPTIIDRLPQHERTFDTGMNLLHYPQKCPGGATLYPALARQGAGLGA